MLFSLIFLGKIISKILFSTYIQKKLSLEDKNEIVSLEKENENKNADKNGKQLKSNEFSESQYNLKRETPVRRWLNDNIDERR